ncbi:MAG: enoyl-CoA hydratase/isomerase family protein [Alphaproteobacteria bacterium]|nr:enoyl-CoA hydratase/isomerase family protein [Alphaproteobacteria bacterium]
MENTGTGVAIDEILFEIINGVGCITLNRSHAENAMTQGQALAMSEALHRWAVDDAVFAVIMRGTAGGEAFCAGTDLPGLHAAWKANDLGRMAAISWAERQLEQQIHTFPKPCVALIQGLVAGCGAALVVHGSHRVTAGSGRFSVPESGAGISLSVSGTYFLPRFPGRVGLYLALTGERVGAADMLDIGVTTHHIPDHRLDEVVDALLMVGLEASTVRDPHGAISCILDAYHEDPGVPVLRRHRPVLDRCFTAASVEAIVAALAQDGGDWALATRAELMTRSPFGLKLAFRRIQAGACLDFERAMILECRVAAHLATHPDFGSALDAAVRGDSHYPAWHPPKLVDIDQKTIDSCFHPLAAEDTAFPCDPPNQPPIG